MKVIVTGGGASGIMAAITAAQNGHSVTILEHSDRIGKKLLVTGNGRCNLSNDELSAGGEGRYHSLEPEELDKKIKFIFNKFGYNETIAFFEKSGLYLKKRGSLVYPYSDSAAAVLDVLRFRLRDLKVSVLTECSITDIKKNDGDCFEVNTDKGIYKSDRLILSCGGKSYPKTGSDGSGYELAKKLGHKITDVTPGLVQLRCSGKHFKSIAGVRTGARITLLDDGKEVYSESGELQITEYGLSGIAVMNISNRLMLCKGRTGIRADLLPELSQKELTDLLNNKISNVTLFCGELLTGILPKKLAELLLKQSGIPLNMPAAELTSHEINNLAGLIKGWGNEVSGTNSFDNAQISLGGVRLSGIKDTLESKRQSGLYFAGEMLDMHGDCGGFNLQLAWSSGAVAGMLL